MLLVAALQNFEETYRMYINLRFYCLVAAGVFLVITIFLFFALDIPQILGELTGRTARKAVRKMKREKETDLLLPAKKKGRKSEKRK